jgi:hypothetical protein
MAYGQQRDENEESFRGSAGGESRFEHMGACPALARQTGAHSYQTSARE